jgi:hypothetical protein
VYESALVSIYIIRSDFVDGIKNKATDCWKMFVDNTPKALKNILPLMISKLIEL